MKRCPTCGRRKPIGEFYLYKVGENKTRPECKACMKAKQKAYREANKDRINRQKREYHRKNKERAAEYRRKNKNTIRTRNRKYRQEHRQELLRRNRERDRHIKLEVLSTYSGGPTPKCACCGEQGLVFLTLDHINGDGKSHRISLGGGNRFYRELQRLGYPNEPELQVLCWNCNCAKSISGECPHQDNRTTV